jgi:hypothetical protein
MTTEYRFDSLADVARYFESRAKINRESAQHAGSKQRRTGLIEAAGAWESAANVLWNATIVIDHSEFTPARSE